MRAGRLRQRVVLQRMATTQNAYGEQVESWSTVGTYWGAIEPLTGRERFMSGERVAGVDVRIVMRYVGSILPTDRISHGGKWYEIQAVINKNDIDREYELHCRQRLASVDALVATSIATGAPILGTPTLTSENWTPSSLDAGNLRVWYDAQDLSVLFQDSALSTPVTGDAEPVGGWVDKPDGNKQIIQATAGNRGTTDSAAGLRFVETDGVSDILRAITASDWTSMHGTAGCGIYAIMRSDNSGSLSFSIGNTVAYNGSSSNVGFRAHVRRAGSNRPTAVVGNGSSLVQAEGTNDSVPVDTAFFGRWENDAVGDVVRAQADDSAGGTASLSSFTHSGSAAGALFVSSLTEVCGYYEIVVRSPVLTSEELTLLTTYWNGIYGTPIL